MPEREDVGDCPECGKPLFINESGTRFCAYCNWWDKGIAES